MERLLKKRRVLRSQTTKLTNETEERQASLTITEAVSFHARLIKLQQQLEHVNEEIEPLVPEEDAENEYQQVYDYQDRITACLAVLQLRVDSGSSTTQAEVNSAGSGTAIQTTTPAPITTTSVKTRVKLPKIELIKFTGRRSDWQAFWEVFEQVVDKNEDLTDTDRFHYLRASVTGDAAAALAGLPSTSRCYNDAIQLLRKRFGNEELLAQEHLKSLIDLKPVRSSDDVRGLRRLYDTLAAHIRGLEVLGRKLDTFSSMLLPIAQRAMPQDILLDFNRSGETSNAQVRVLCDGGSQRSYITSDTSRKMGCTLLGHERLIVGVFGGHQEEREFRRVRVTLKTRRGCERELEVLETDVICDQPIPSPPGNVLQKLISLGYEAADFSTDSGAEKVELLIGSDHLWDFTTGRCVKLGKRLRAVETSIGWSVQGPIESDIEQTNCLHTVTLRTSVIEKETTDILTKFWTLESIGVNESEDNEKPCEALEFFEDIKRDGNRYEVALPWKSEISLEDNKEIALKRLSQLANRLRRAPDLLQEYDTTIRQYGVSDIAERVEDETIRNHCVYHMPHQAVIRDSRKLRVVFDASSRGKNSKSLNDNLETGPNLTADL
ncbi:hypothetical protein V5799_010628, partial [Amblyomma americanum]